MRDVFPGEALRIESLGLADADADHVIQQMKKANNVFLTAPSFAMTLLFIIQILIIQSGSKVYPPAGLVKRVAVSGDGAVPQSGIGTVVVGAGAERIRAVAILASQSASQSA